jgi:hypothetical protein
MLLIDQSPDERTIDEIAHMKVSHRESMFQLETAKGSPLYKASHWVMDSCVG